MARDYGLTLKDIRRLDSVNGHLERIRKIFKQVKRPERNWIINRMTDDLAELEKAKKIPVFKKNRGKT
jgi:hypothetical protein